MSTRRFGKDSCRGCGERVPNSSKDGFLYPRLHRLKITDQLTGARTTGSLCPGVTQSHGPWRSPSPDLKNAATRQRLKLSS